jgi:hypothetical protein
MTVKTRLLWLAPLLATAMSLPASAQRPEGRNEIVTTEPRLGSVYANAPIPVHFHLKNEGSAVDGLGLCVFCATLINGGSQGIPDMQGGKESLWWRDAKSRPGGGYPSKFEDFANEHLPGVKWVSWEGVSTALIEQYNRRGFPVAITINTAEIYGWQRIHHFVSLCHVDSTLACYVDNNDPGKYHWITRAELDKRFVDGAKGWFVVFIWERIRWMVYVGGSLALVGVLLAVAPVPVREVEIES